MLRIFSYYLLLSFIFFPFLGHADICNPTVITGTSNQVLANGITGSPLGGAVTLTTPQDIATTSSPQFGGLKIGTSSLSGMGPLPSLMNIVGQSGNTVTKLTTYSNLPAQCPIDSVGKSRGTLATPTSIQEGDFLYRKLIYGYSEPEGWSIVGEWAYTAGPIDGVSGIPSAKLELYLNKSGETFGSLIQSWNLDGSVSFNAVNVSNRITLDGGLVVPPRVVTAAGAVTVTTADYIVVVNKTVGAATTVNLPGSPVAGQTFIIKDGKGDAATNNITITPAAGNIDGSATYVVNTNYASVTVVYNGTEWNII